MAGAPDARARAAFLATRRRIARERYDHLFASTYDEEWGAIAASHRAMVERFLAAIVPGGRILDAACGTGKYWPAILASGRRVDGIDQSAGMLAVARRKHAAVRTRLVGLQELDERERYDGVMCVDALENVGPEDWPGVAKRLSDAAKRDAPIYLTVELYDPSGSDLEEESLEEAMSAGRATGEPVVMGEHLNIEGGYHYYPERDRVLAWLAGAGMAVDETLEADSYLHVLAHRAADQA